jgi:hypothetical protein
MKYTLTSQWFGVESETDADGNYSVVLTLNITPTDGIAPNFHKDITVTSNNSMTGFQVDAQREQAVTDFMAQINA